jgi:hypothetical protein
VPAFTHAVDPLALVTSHVWFDAHPHCGESPHDATPPPSAMGGFTHVLLPPSGDGLPESPGGTFPESFPGALPESLPVTTWPESSRATPESWSPPPTSDVPAVAHATAPTGNTPSTPSTKESRFVMGQPFLRKAARLDF